MLKNLRKNRLLSGLFLSFSTALLISGVFVPACAADDTANIPGVCTTFTQDCTPATGNVRMPVFLVDFADEHFSKDALTADNIAHVLFSDVVGSMYTFMKNASYGQLQLDGDVFSYTAQYSSSVYESNPNGFEMLSEEVLNAFDDQIDYQDYDSNDDGYIDAFTLTIVGTHDYWYGCQATWYDDTGFSVDGVKPMLYIINDAQPYRDEIDYFVDEMCHEFGHCMGLPDYYKYNENDDEAMNGVAGSEMMDEMYGDYCQFYKLMLG